MAAISQKYLEGYLAAMTEVATVVAQQPLKGMSGREWKLICAVQERLARVAAEYAKDLVK